MGRSRRLLIVYPSNLVVCGVGTWLELLSQELTRRGWDVTVGLAWGARHHRPEEVERVRPELRTVWMDGRTGGQARRVRAIRRAIRDVEPDVVLITLLHDALEATLREKQAGRPVRTAVALHGNAPQHLAVCLETAPHLDLVACVNRACEQVLREWPGRPLAGVLERIPNAVRPPIVERSPRNDALRIGLVGRLHDDKRICDLPPLVDELARRGVTFRLCVAGEGPGDAIVKGLVERRPEQVEYLGPVTQDRLYRDVYPRLDVLLSFSPSEGWPLAIAEAMAHGVVPVCSEFTGIHLENVVRDGESGLVFPVGRPMEAATAVERLDDDRDLLDRLSRGAAEVIQTSYTPQIFGDAWSRVLTGCCARPPRRPMGPVERTTFADFRQSAAAWLRWKVGRGGIHSTARGEWPTLATTDEALRSRVSAALEGVHVRSNEQALVEATT